MSVPLRESRGTVQLPTNLVRNSLVDRLVHEAPPKYMGDQVLTAEPLFIWTESLPTEPGWYWRKPNPHYLMPYIVHVERTFATKDAKLTSLCIWDVSERRHREIDDMGGIWAGPIVEPVDA